jgi:hypothetical protein
MGEKRADPPDNKAREKARRALEREITIPDYTELVGATVGQRMSIATDTTMAHLSTFIFLSHARLKAEQCSVGEDSPPADIESADDYVRRARDQIEMVHSTSEVALERTGARGTILDTWAAYLTMTHDSRRHWHCPKGRRGIQVRQDTRPSPRTTKPRSQR